MNPIAILHLEDSTLDADLIQSRLEQAGLDCRVDRAPDRARFLALLGPGSHDLILADYSLPDFDGLAALEVARRVAPQTPFLFVSGQLGEELAIETLKSGATDYVLKQRLGRLVPAIRRALAEARERADRRRAEEALREGEARHRLILDGLKDYAVVTVDTGGLVRSWNAGAEAVFGYPEAEVLGLPMATLYAPEDALAGVPAELLAHARAAGRREDERWYVRRCGERFWGTGVLVTLLDDAGRLHGFTAVVRDATERKRAQDALIEADRRKDEFLAMLAHELRNPLAAIHNAIHLTRRQGLPADRQEWARGVIAHQAGHLGRLVDDLLDVSRINRGKIQLRPERVDLGEVARRAMEVTRPLFEERHHALNVRLGPGPLALDADPTRLEQMVVNLLTNAAKYTDKGGTVTLAAAREGGRLALTVRDNGVGMTAELLGRAFDLFAQADDSLDRTRGGLGIGLTVVRKLAELHGGTVTATSPGPGLGSEFRLELPAAAEDAPAAAAADSDVPAATADGARPARILVVDDNVATACSLAELLRLSGHEVATAHDGADAIEAARQHRPEILLLDIGLPVLDGYEITRRLRREADFRRALFVAITGYGEDQAIVRSREAGFDHHLVKPVDLDHLFYILTNALQAAPGPGAAAG